jgi:V/A-type H+/Na+-transporting ATPase subunit A
MQETARKGEIVFISGPVVKARISQARMYDLVKVGEKGLVGEIIEISGEIATIQVYEETDGLAPGEIVQTTGALLSVELGPGLLSSIYDGIQRPLESIRKKQGDFLTRGMSLPGLDRKKKWKFSPSKKKGDVVGPGESIGTVNDYIELKVLVPPDYKKGKIDVIHHGEFTVEEEIASLSGQPISLLARWPVRKQRPFKGKMLPFTPLITGQRVIDAYYPLLKGGTACVPGPFGSGKTVIQHQLAKWSDADVIVYVGCGERGNEMSDVLEELPRLTDPRTHKPLMERTVLVANTSDMPVAAREASVYTGITIAEYFRDMGLNVALMADSTSRWAEAMREISGRLKEMPSEEGFPAYLASRISEFYERAGAFETLGGEKGTITLIGAVSPPGGDFSEPMTQATLRIAKVFWALDANLAYGRHFPAINWLTSYSLYNSDNWWEKIDKQFPENRKRTMEMLEREAEIKEIVRLVGVDSLPDADKLLLRTAQAIRENFLQQNAFDEFDTYTAPKEQAARLGKIVKEHDSSSQQLSEGKRISELKSGEDDD